ncbi:uncharacterized protein LOC143244659 [Tachypleus tridentatus]|uniref:uncharacterized protein LOC143244659 n=1 Tax=Tachypleus tridentatus TaxID=6853 RepID=UPI003FD4404A
MDGYKTITSENSVEMNEQRKLASHTYPLVANSSNKQLCTKLKPVSLPEKRKSSLVSNSIVAGKHPKVIQIENCVKTGNRVLKHVKSFKQQQFGESIRLNSDDTHWLPGVDDGNPLARRTPKYNNEKLLLHPVMKSDKCFRGKQLSKSNVFKSHTSIPIIEISSDDCESPDKLNKHNNGSFRVQSETYAGDSSFKFVSFSKPKYQAQKVICHSHQKNNSLSKSIQKKLNSNELGNFNGLRPKINEKQDNLQLDCSKMMRYKNVFRKKPKEYQYICTPNDFDVNSLPSNHGFNNFFNNLEKRFCKIRKTVDSKKKLNNLDDCDKFIKKISFCPNSLSLGCLSKSSATTPLSLTLEGESDRSSETFSQITETSKKKANDLPVHEFFNDHKALSDACSDDAISSFIKLLKNNSGAGENICYVDSSRVVIGNKDCMEDKKKVVSDSSLDMSQCVLACVPVDKPQDLSTSEFIGKQKLEEPLTCMQTSINELVIHTNTGKCKQSVGSLKNKPGFSRMKSVIKQLDFKLINKKKIIEKVNMQNKMDVTPSTTRRLETKSSLRKISSQVFWISQSTAQEHEPLPVPQISRPVDMPVIFSDVSLATWNTQRQKKYLFEKKHISVIEACFEEGPEYFHVALRSIRDFTTTIRRPHPALIERLLHKLMKVQTTRDAVETYITLLHIHRYHNVIKEISWWTYIELALGELKKTIYKIESTSSYTAFYACSLLLKFVVHVLHSEVIGHHLVHNVFTFSQYTVYKLLSPDISSSQVKTIVAWLEKAIAWEKILISFRTCKVNVKTMNIPSERALFLLQKLLALAVLVSKVPSMAVQSLACTMQHLFQRLETWSEKWLFMCSIQSDYLRLSLSEMILKKHFKPLSDISPLANIYQHLPLSCSKILYYYFCFTPNNHEENHQTPSSSSPFVELVWLLTWLLKSYIDTVAGQQKLPLHRKVHVREIGTLSDKDKKCLQCIDDCVDKLEFRIYNVVSSPEIEEALLNLRLCGMNM